MNNSQQLWRSVYEGVDERKFFEAADHPKWQWRSVEAIARDSGLECNHVRAIVDKYVKMGLVISHPKNEHHWGYWENIPIDILRTKMSSRPCNCDRIPLPPNPYTTEFCRLCWLWHNDARYRTLWGGPPSLPTEPPPLPMEPPPLPTEEQAMLSPPPTLVETIQAQIDVLMKQEEACMQALSKVRGSRKMMEESLAKARLLNPHWKLDTAVDDYLANVSLKRLNEMHERLHQEMRLPKSENPAPPPPPKKKESSVVKNVLAFVAVAVLFIGGQQGYKWYTTPVEPPEPIELTPPGQEARVLMKSMREGWDWRPGKNGDSIVHEEANMVVEYSTKDDKAKVTLWQANRPDQPPKITMFDDNDLRHINNAYPEARKAVERTCNLNKIKR